MKAASVPHAAGEAATRVELVAVRGDDQSVSRMRVERDDGKAHARGSDGRDERLGVPSTVLDPARYVVARHTGGELAFEQRHVGDVFVDFHPGPWVVAAHQHASSHARVQEEVGEQRVDRCARGNGIAD